MVFESLIVDLINRYLGTYVETLNTSQLNIGFLSGNAHLENLDLKSNAFDDLNLPIRVLQGHISSLIIKIPFKNIYSEPTIVQLDGLYVLLVPNVALKYDEQQEKRHAKAAKDKELANIEAIQKRQRTPDKKDEVKSDSFGEKLAAQIIKNLEIQIKNIHVRYEDAFSIPGQVFSIGITLSELNFQTCNSDQRPFQLQGESIREFYKSVKLKCFGMYCNHNSVVFSKKPTGPLRLAMKNAIASPENSKHESVYILQPISADALLHIHTRPKETNFTVSFLDIIIELSEINLTFSLYQYRVITSLLGAVDQMITQSKYRKYRPDVPFSGNARSWWKYAYNSILEEFVRRRRRMWSWSFISKHRTMAKAYTILFKKRLNGESLTAEGLKSLEEYEEHLDVFNIILCRRQAEIQHSTRKAPQNTSTKGRAKSGWFSWLSRSSPDANPAPGDSGTGGNLMQRIQMDITEEEKAKLFAAIDYDDGGGSVTGSSFPPEFVSTVVGTTLRQFSITLIDERLSNSRIFNLSVNKVTVQLEQRAGAQAISVKLRLDSLEAVGVRPSSKSASLVGSLEPPILITSQQAMLQRSSDGRVDANRPASDHLLMVDFDKNPIDRKVNQRIRLRAQPLQLIYDAETVKKIFSFMAPPEDFQIHEISNTVFMSIEEAREITKSGLRHLASRREYTEVHVDVLPSYFILPDSGVYRSNCRLLLVDLGSFTVRSSPNKTFIKESSASASEPGAAATALAVEQKASFEELKESAYDIFNISVSSVQVILVEAGDNWCHLRSIGQSPRHILRPLGVNFALKRCLIRNDVNLPKIVVDGCLPVFDVDLTNTVLISLCELVANVPFPEPDKRLTTPEDPSAILKDAFLLPMATTNELANRDQIKAVCRLGRSESQSTMSSWLADEDERQLQDDSVDNDDDEAAAGEDSSDTEVDRSRKPAAAAGSAGARITRPQHDASGQGRRRTNNLVDLAVSFQIRMIQVRLLQSDEKMSKVTLQPMATPNPTTVIKFQPKKITSGTVNMVVSIHDVGTRLLKRRWDQELQAHVGTLSISVPRFTNRQSGDPVCLVKTKRHIEGHHLLAVSLLIADKEAPDFASQFNNARHQLQCNFKELEVCVHQDAVLLLIEFSRELVNSLVLSSTASKGTVALNDEAAWSRVGDQQALSSATLEATASSFLPKDLTAMQAVEEHLTRRRERREIRLGAYQTALKAGKTMVIREINIVQWLVKAKLEMVNVTLCSSNGDLLSTTVRGLRFDVQTSYQQLELSAVLSEFTVLDNIDATNYRKIVWVDPGDSMVSLQLRHFGGEAKLPENVCNPDKVDMALSIQIGKMYTVFLHHFVIRLLNFMNAFQTAIQAVQGKLQELSDAAVQQVQQAVVQSELRLALSVNVRAPVIYVPQHSFSTKALMIDLGQLTYENRFECRPVGEVGSSSGAMLEHSTVRLINLRVSRGILSDTSVNDERGVIHPINFELRLCRNLSPSLNTDLPLLTIEGGLETIHITLCQKDYQIVQEILLDNFAEVPEAVAPSVVVVQSKTTPITTIGQTPPAEQQASLPPKKVLSIARSTTAVRFTVKMDKVTMHLYTGDRLDSGDFIPNSQLALCEMTSFTVAGQVGLDSSCEVGVKLNSISLNDTRPDAEKQITRILDSRSLDLNQQELVSVDFKRSADGNQKVLVRLRGLQLCASMDYLMALANFHIDSAPRSEKHAELLTPVTATGKRKRQQEPPFARVRTRRPSPQTPDRYDNDLELVVEVGDPELILVEDIRSLDTNCLKLTASFEFKYSIVQDVAVMNATVKNFVMVTCPFSEKVGGKYSREIVTPTEFNYYSSQRRNGPLQGSFYLDDLLVKISPSTIQLISHIVTSLTSVKVGASASDRLPTAESQMATSSSVQTFIRDALARRGSRASVHSGHPDAPVSEKQPVNFWTPVSIECLQMAYLKSASAGPVDSPSKKAITSGCDVSQVLEQLEGRSIDQIVVRVPSIRVFLESQVGTKTVPMLALESCADGEVLNPTSKLEMKITVDLSLSYYNDALSQWEQLLETLTDEDDHMWSLQFEMVTSNIEEQFAEEDWEEVGCLQVANKSLLLVSRNNLELTVSKSALDMLTNLGKTFEAAYNQRQPHAIDGVVSQNSALYQVQNYTGWPIQLRTDASSMELFDELQRLSFASDASYVSSPAYQSVACILESGKELRLSDSKPSTSKVATLRSISDNAPQRSLWLSWLETQPSSGREQYLGLYKGKSHILRIPRTMPAPECATPGSQSQGQKTKVVAFPVVAQITSQLGMRIFKLRSTVQVLNNTQERLCLYSRVAPGSAHNQPSMLARLEPGQVYALPVSVVNSNQCTGIYIGPEIFGSALMSSQAAYWPQAASVRQLSATSTVNLPVDREMRCELTYLNPLSERPVKDRVIRVQGSCTKLRSIEDALASNIAGPSADDGDLGSGGGSGESLELASLVKWPVQLLHYQYSAQSVPVVASSAAATPAAATPAAVIAEATDSPSVRLSTSRPSDTHYYLLVSTLTTGYDSKDLDESTAVAQSLSTALGSLCDGDFCMMIQYPVVLHNQLPVRLHFVLPDISGEVKPGCQCPLRTISPYKSMVDVWFEYDTRVYRGRLQITTPMEELSVVEFESREGYELRHLHLGLRKVQIHDHTALTIYTPYWMVNKTGKNLTYKSANSDVEIHHPATFTDAVIYSSLAKSVFGKFKANLRVDDSSWSDRFSLDTVGSSGRVNCKTKDNISYEIGVKIDLSSSGLTKIVTFMPYFLIVNKASIDLDCKEVDDAGRDATVSWTLVPAGEAVPFWPRATTSNKMLLRCRVSDDLVTDAFPFYESYSVLMKLFGKYAGVFVEVQTTEEATVITLQMYQDGMAPVRLVNHLGDSQLVFYQQRGVDQIYTLESGMSCLYAWDCPKAQRELVFYCDPNDRQRSDNLTTDSVEEFYVNDTKAYWVSFMWNMQRLLLFTHDVAVAKNARLSAELENIDQEVFISLQSIGLSLVDNARRVEVMYLSITSSGVRWSQVKRGNRLKVLKTAVSDSLEQAYTKHMNRLAIGESSDGLVKLTDGGRLVEVDFTQMMMVQPVKCELRRAFEPGVFVHYKTSPSQMQIHAKIFKFQVDNQKADCTFPVVLAPYPQPKSVALDSGPKPLVELSAIIGRMADPGAFRFKYFRVLIQEMQLKLDQGFLTDMFDFFAQNLTHIPEEEAFQRDLKRIRDKLVETPVVLSRLREGKRSMFDNVHISPIKMHVSFSLTGSSEGQSSAFPSEVLNLFLQSLGIALTDVQDVIFKLVYFERQACIMTINQMVSEMNRHYISQGIRQLYVLVLGLDVLGNPFGVLRGLAQGVEDLFYEPVKGAILGPEEFAEGVALGVKSLFGHAVGGAAGAVSRITGTLGKGIAALTLDEDYKRSRREQLTRQPDTLGAGLAQGGRGLVMGVFHGITGVVMKPVEGAKKAGVEGFFKGVGKGLVGVVTRPISGVVDFASSSFEGIRKIADTVEVVSRVRPPRYIRVDGVIRPYVRREAEGHLILRQVDKEGTYGHYVHHLSAAKSNSSLVLTSSYLLIIECIDLLGSWSINWQTKLSALDGVPVVNRSGILITLKEKQKKLFKADNLTKQFDCEHQEAKVMVSTVDRIVSRQH